jgi:hypothetical protein
MSARVQADYTNEYGGANLSLTAEFTPVVACLDEQKPFKRLPAYACSGARLNPGANEK